MNWHLIERSGVKRIRIRHNGEDHYLATLRAAKEWCPECEVKLAKRTGDFNQKKKRKKPKDKKKPDLVMKAAKKLIERSDQMDSNGSGIVRRITFRMV